MTHKWAGKSGGGLVATLWTTQPLKVALMKSTFSPDFDTQVTWGDIAAQEVAGAGYTAGGQALAGRATNYDASQDRTNLVANDTTWGPGLTVDAAHAVIYDSGSGAIWSHVNFEEVKSIVDGSFTLDWATIGVLSTIPI